ncbi:MAG: threonine--tRNA ligase [Candidatus Altiarchaeota archaeon]|nr:threonine--tRNA ligase [Candidatus Altiarchaeota archaeon]
MRVLLIHSDYLRFEAKKKALKTAEELEEKKGETDNVLVVFIASEKPDESNPESVVKQLVSEVKGLYQKVNAESIALYPYAHLSSNLSSPDVAKKIIDGTYVELRNEYNVVKAPFGWYKSFELRCKGHPLSELSRTILPEDAIDDTESKALAAEEKLESHWHILDLDGSLVNVEDFNFGEHKNLKKFTDYEISGTRAVELEPPHVKYMREHEIADYEPGSDPGNLRWYPKGSLIKRLLEEKVSSMVSDYGGMQVETPIMYDIGHPQLSKYLDRFPARQYRLKSGGRDYFLRFAACFGQYLMKKDMLISYKNLPLKLYELSHYSFRHEQRGELAGLRRLRTFTMPDMHTLVIDTEQAKSEFLAQYRLSVEWMESLGLDYEVGIRFVREFYEENKDFADELVAVVGKPALVELWDERPFYFVMKFEFNIVDALEKASALSTVQIDIENTERFDISYTCKQGKKKHPLMLHASLSGSIDRNVYALLEKAYLDSKKGKKPMLPLWLSPTQVRILPLSDEFMDLANDLADRLEKNNVRVDIDDRNESVGKKIRAAEKEWIPRIIVLGAKEAESGKYAIRVREENKQMERSLDELITEVRKEMGDEPFKPLPLSRNLSTRPRFV